MKLVAKKVGGKGVGHAVEKEYSEKKKVSIKSRIYSLAKIIWAVTLANEKNTKLRQQTKARNNGLIVLTDRYPQTLYAGCSDGPLLSKYEGKGLFGKIAAWEHRVYESAGMNPPDLTVKLIVPTEVAIERKPEMTADEIDTKKSIVMGLKLSDNTLVVDTSRPFEDTRAGLPGCGKSTVSHLLAERLRVEGFKVSEPSYSIDHQKPLWRKIRKFLLGLYYYIF